MTIAAGGLATKLKYMGFLAIFAGTIGVASPPAKAGDLMDFLTGAIEEEDTIAYPERGPLVVPPSLKLTTPKESAAATNPAWPKDPDVERKRKAKEAALAATKASRPVDPSRPLTPEELAAGRVPGAGLPDSTVSAGRKDASKPLTPQEMQALNDEFARKRQMDAQAAAAPKSRVYLTDPPTVYRQPAVLTPEMQAQAAAAGQPVNAKPWYQFW